MYNAFFFIFVFLNISFFSTAKTSIITDKNSSTSSFSTILEGKGGSFTVYDNILFYTGYDALNTSTVPEGVQRIHNALYYRKLSEQQLSTIGDNLKMDITIKAACDNYDRIGRVYLSFVEKGKAFDVSKAQNIEIGRYITPFMNKNINPNSVPYSFNVNNISQILRDKIIRKTYDIYVGFSVFGASYAAQSSISGCQGNNSTFYGTLVFSSTQSPAKKSDKSTYFKSLAYMNLFGDGNDNVLNYRNKNAAGAETTIRLNLDNDISDAKLYLISSNHGANPGGEEYTRRVHNVYFDNALKLRYTPGGLSCEPFRIFNTQANGIYGQSPQSDDFWKSWNNWCPGDKIPIRVIDLGDLEKGQHTFKFQVESASFPENQGYIPLAVYLQGKVQTCTKGCLESTANKARRIK